MPDYLAFSIARDTSGRTVCTPEREGPTGPLEGILNTLSARGWQVEALTETRILLAREVETRERERRLARALGVGR